MESFLFNAIPVLEAVVFGVGVLTVAATFAVQFTSSKKDDVFVEKVEGFFIKAVRWLPTIGINPKTKALEEAIKDAKMVQLTRKVIEEAEKVE